MIVYIILLWILITMKAPIWLYVLFGIKVVIDFVSKW